MNHFSRFFFGFLSVLSTSFADAQSNVTHQIMQDTLQRSFIVHLPTGYNAANPVSCVFNLHGSGMTGSYQQLYSKMDAVANANGFMVVYPNGISNSWLVGSSGAYGENTRDVEFINSILDTLETLYSIDPARVFACGLSQGGYMTHRLASDLQDRFAAVASVAASISDSSMYYCKNLRPVPVLLINGTEDAFVSYAWAENAVDFWSGRNVCDLAAETTNLPDLNAADNSTVQHIVYTDCENDAAVEVFRIIGGGHTWPSPFLNLTSYGNTNYDISASQEIWKFFNRFSIHGSVAETVEQETLEVLNIFPNPVNDKLHVSGINPPFQVEVFNLEGMQMLRAENPEQVDLSGLPNGFYHVRINNARETVVRKIVKY